MESLLKGKDIKSQNRNNHLHLHIQHFLRPTCWAPCWRRRSQREVTLTLYPRHRLVWRSNMKTSNCKQGELQIWKLPQPKKEVPKYSEVGQETTWLILPLLTLFNSRHLRAKGCPHLRRVSQNRFLRQAKHGPNSILKTIPKASSGPTPTEGGVLHKLVFSVN